jgi:hypothetical protein
MDIKIDFGHGNKITPRGAKNKLASTVFLLSMSKSMYK